MSNLALYDFMESNNISEWTIDDVIKCEQYFQIDHRYFILRLLSEKLINEFQFAEFSMNIINKAANLGYNTSLYEPSVQDKVYYSVGHMIPLINKSYENKIISKGRRKDILLDLFRDEIAY